jgi:hypothetical protein
MEIFFYVSSQEVPFETLYNDELFPNSQLLLISNRQQFMDLFANLQNRIIDEGIGDIAGKKIFVPLSVKEIFLNWLKTRYTAIHWQRKENNSNFLPASLTGELGEFFQRLQIGEEWEGTEQSEMPTEPPETVTDQPQHPSDLPGNPTDVDENTESKFATATAGAFKYVSMGFATVVLLSLAVILLFFLKPIAEIRKVQEQSLTPSESSGKNDISPIEVELKKYEIPMATAIHKDNKWYVTNKGQTEENTVFWIAKEIWKLQAKSRDKREEERITQETENALDKIITAYSTELSTDVTKCVKLQRIYDFLCKEPKLGASKKKINEQFSTCKLVH